MKHRLEEQVSVRLLKASQHENELMADRIHRQLIAARKDAEAATHTVKRFGQVVGRVEK